MALSLAVSIACAMIFGKLCTVVKLPPLLGMLAAGMLLGSSGLSLIHPDLMQISPDLRTIALLIILLRAGFGIEKENLKKSGRSAFLLSTVPVLLEGAAVLILGYYLLGFTIAEAGMLGFIIAAVSPAVIVPAMLLLIEQRRGTSSGIPTMVLTAASVDDVLAVTLFSVFTGLYGGSQAGTVSAIFSVPISVATGILLGICAAYFLIFLFEHIPMRDTKKTLVILSLIILMPELESFFPVAALLGVMTLGFMLKQRYTGTASRLASKFSKIWVFAEMLLFVLIGAQVDISAAADAGWAGLLIICGGLAARSIGVMISTFRTQLGIRHRVFTAVAMTPKATVQAAIGAVPLSMGVPSGDIILALAVLSVLITAPAGSIGIRVLSRRWLAVSCRDCTDR